MTDEIEELLEQIARRTDCSIVPPSQPPVLRSGDTLPADVARFYQVCGGASLFEGSAYPARIVSPHELVRANPEIVGSDHPDDITDSWYIIARGGSEEAISIDCATPRLGRCYDSFWDRHGVRGDCPIVARSFTELLARLVDNRGEHWYWLRGAGTGYGDAYDGT